MLLKNTQACTVIADKAYDAQAWLIEPLVQVGKVVAIAPSRLLDFTRFNRHLLRSKLNWRVSHEECQIPSRI